MLKLWWSRFLEFPIKIFAWTSVNIFVFWVKKYNYRIIFRPRVKEVRSRKRKEKLLSSFQKEKKKKREKLPGTWVCLPSFPLYKGKEKITVKKEEPERDKLWKIRMTNIVFMLEI